MPIQENVMTQAQTTTDTPVVKRGRGRPAMLDVQRLSKETQRLSKLLAHKHNSNPLSVAKSGLTTPEQHITEAASLASVTTRVTPETYGVRKSAKRLAEAVANAVAQNLSNAQIAMVIYTTRNVKNQMSDGVAETLERLSKGEVVEMAEMPQVLHQYL